MKELKLLPGKMHILPKSMYSVLLQAVLKSLKSAYCPQFQALPKVTHRYPLAISGSECTFTINNVISMRTYALIKNS